MGIHCTLTFNQGTALQNYFFQPQNYRPPNSVLFYGCQHVDLKKKEKYAEWEDSTVRNSRALSQPDLMLDNGDMKLQSLRQDGISE